MLDLFTQMEQMLAHIFEYFSLLAVDIPLGLHYVPHVSGQGTGNVGRKRHLVCWLQLGITPSGFLWRNQILQRLKRSLGRTKHGLQVDVHTHIFFPWWQGPFDLRRLVFSRSHNDAAFLC